MNKIFDFLLLSKIFYKKISDKLLTLYIGILFIGVVDIVFIIINNWKILFADKSVQIVFYNVSLSVTMIILLGLMDIVFFTVPLFDLFKMFRIESDFTIKTNKLVKFMKIYIYAHLPVLPVVVIVFFLNKTKNNYFNQDIKYFALYALNYFIIPLWFSAVITRGVNATFTFIKKFRMVIYIIVFGWYMLLSTAFEFINSYILTLFK